MKITFKCSPRDIAELLKVVGISAANSKVKENADKAVVEQNRLNFNKSDPAKICEIIIDGISKMINQDSPESTDDIN